MHTTPSLVASIAASIVAVGAMLVSLRSPESRPPAADPRIDELVTRHRRLRADCDELQRAHEALAERLARAETLRVTPPAAPDRAPTTAPAPTRPDARETPETAAEPVDRTRLRERLAELFRSGTHGPTMSEAEQERFWRQLRTTPLLDERIAELEATLAHDPGDVATRMELADVYTAKLSTIPGGPEQGVWGGKAERQWQEVISQQPEHWEARFALGSNYSMYPSFVDRSSEAIEHLEVARGLLATMPAEPRQADVFGALARMYARQGNHDAARPRWRRACNASPATSRCCAHGRCSGRRRSARGSRRARSRWTARALRP